MSFVDCSGVLRFDDLLQIGTQKDINHIHDLQYKLHCDEPINIQFTSVSTVHLFIFVSGSLLDRTNVQSERKAFGSEYMHLKISNF